MLATAAADDQDFHIPWKI